MAVLAGFGAVDTGGSAGSGGSNAPGRTFLNLGAPFTSDGIFTNFEISVRTVPSAPLVMRVFRENGSDYDVVGQAEAFLPTATGVTSLTLSSPINVLVGDLIGIFIPSSSGSNILNYTSSSSTLKWQTADVSGTVSQSSFVSGIGSSIFSFTANGTIVASNAAPTANAGADQANIVAGATVTLDGSGSSDSDGTIATYAWTQTAGTTVTLSNAAIAGPTFTAPTTGSAQNLVFQLTVTDDDGATHSDSVTIGVLAEVVANNAPTANAGADQTNIAAGATVTLDGSGSSDSDGTIASYAWTQTAGTTVTLSNAAIAGPTFTAPTTGSDQNLVFQLTVTDDDGATHSDSVTIGVLANNAPTANAGADQANIVAGATVTLDGSGSSDSDGTIASYAWTQTAGTTVTLSNAAIAGPTFTAPTTGSDQNLVFQLTVTDDDGATHSDSVTIGVLAEVVAITTLKNTLTILAYLNKPAALTGAIYKNRPNKIIITVDDGAINPADYSSINFGLFSLSGTTALVSKTLDDGITISNGQIIIDFNPSDVAQSGSFYMELTIGDSEPAQVLSVNVKVTDTRL
jgi:hypothetical protein